MGRSIKTAISLDSKLFERSEALAAELGLSRSAFFAQAVAKFLRDHETKRMMEAIKAACADGPDEEERMLSEWRLRHLGQLLEKEDHFDPPR